MLWVVHATSWGFNGYLLNPQEFQYDCRMPQMKQINLRLSAAQIRTLEQLAAKLHIDRANVIRLAITRLAEAENVGIGPRRTG
jgi:hypothetical protein